MTHLSLSLDDMHHAHAPLSWSSHSFSSLQLSHHLCSMLWAFVTFLSSCSQALNVCVQWKPAYAYGRDVQGKESLVIQWTRGAGIINPVLFDTYHTSKQLVYGKGCKGRVCLWCCKVKVKGEFVCGNSLHKPLAVRGPPALLTSSSVYRWNTSLQ